ncbi:aldo/keto reductase [Streptosporangium sp. NPDC048047]|uniref:aldo/keto reductase n=1 Tax=Streptosporangium sp. NPDC048047 TaxID=3155748 RepID=UPI00342864F5
MLWRVPPFCDTLRAPAPGPDWSDPNLAQPTNPRSVAAAEPDDTADVYSRGSSEEVTGRPLSKIFTDRDDYVLATKVFFPVGPGSKKGGAGKARYLGASSMSAWQFAKAQHIAETNDWTKFAAMQNHYDKRFASRGKFTLAA